MFQGGSARVEVLVLGSGTSHGVPMIGCDCPVCTSQDPRDRRTRPSVFLRAGDAHLLVDTAPELRQQCVDHGIRRLDAVLFTHHHADHVVGLDDLRRFNWLKRGPVNCYANQRTWSSLHKMFSYAFEQRTDDPTSRPVLHWHTIQDEPFEVEGQVIIPIPVLHGTLPILGFRIGNFAYCTDCSEIPPASLDRLRNLEVLILDGLRNTPHPTHFNLEQAVEMARVIGARRTYFTHIAHELMHLPTNLQLPQGMELAYDGLRFETN